MHRRLHTDSSFVFRSTATWTMTSRLQKMMPQQSNQRRPGLRERPLQQRRKRKPDKSRRQPPAHLRHRPLSDCQPKQQGTASCTTIKNLWQQSSGCGSKERPTKYTAGYSWRKPQDTQAVQMLFEQRQASFDPNAVMAVLEEHPYHVDALLAMHELYRSMGEVASSNEMLERCIMLWRWRGTPVSALQQLTHAWTTATLSTDRSSLLSSSRLRT